MRFLLALFTVIGQFCKEMTVLNLLNVNIMHLSNYLGHLLLLLLLLCVLSGYITFTSVVRIILKYAI